MRRSPLASIVASAAWMVLACSSNSSHPRELGPCEVDDASCPVPVLGGGASGGADDGATPSLCAANAGDSLCSQCADANCCAALGACQANTDCEYLLGCGQSCTGSPPSKGEPLLNTLESCIRAKCPVCSELGIGDPCATQGGACNPGLSCSGLWCTKPCVRSTDCTGLGAAGGNALGLPNACIEIGPAADACSPGCDTDADCIAFPGSFCFSTTSSEGLYVRVCAPPPDAGTD